MDQLQASPSFPRELQRDAGLIRGISTFGLGAGIVNGVVGAGIFALPSAMARDAGGWAPLAFAVCAIAMAAVVVCFAEAGSRVPTSGGPYGFVAAALGPGAGFLTGLLLWLSSVVACGGIAAALADGLGSLAPILAGTLARTAIILVAIGGIAAVNLRGVRHASRLAATATVIKMLPLAVFLAVGAWGLATIHLPKATHAGPFAFGHAMILAVFALCGMETILGASGEVANPARTLPRALFGAMIFVVCLYVGIQVIAQGLLGAALAGSAAPLADAMGQVSATARVVLLVGAALSMLGWIASDILGAPRILFAFARDGHLPAILARLQSGTQVPAVAICLHASLAALLAISGSFVPLAIMSTLYTAGLYILSCAAAYLLRRRRVAQAGRPLDFALTPLCAVVGVCSMVLLCLAADWGQILGLIVTIFAGIALFAATARKGA